MPSENQHLREFQSSVFRQYDLTDEFNEFVIERVLPLVLLPGYKQTQKKEILANVVHNLILCELAGGVVADSRNNATNGLRVGVWDAVVVAKLATKCVGSEISKKVTRYRATGKLVRLRERWDLQILTGISNATPDGRELIRLHTGKRDVFGDKLPEARQKQPIDLRKYIAERAQVDESGNASQGAGNGMAHWRDVSDVIARINAMNLNHGWAARRTHDDGTESVWQPSVSLCQIHSGNLHSVGRLCTATRLSGQSLPKKERRRMLIDGQATAEVDYSGMHPRMLYHRACQNPVGDVYKPEVVLRMAYKSATADQQKTLREFIKRATNICLNVLSRSAANSSVAKAMLDADDPDYIASAVGNLDEVVSQLVAAHPAIADNFFTGVGMELMDIEGKIMLRIMSDLASENIPAMPIYDSICCRSIDAIKVEEAMNLNYEMFMNYKPIITRVY